MRESERTGGAEEENARVDSQEGARGHLDQIITCLNRIRGKRRGGLTSAARAAARAAAFEAEDWRLAAWWAAAPGAAAACCEHEVKDT